MQIYKKEKFYKNAKASNNNYRKMTFKMKKRKISNKILILTMKTMKMI